ncbi:MAG: hypothetical protein ABWY19_01630, partial [Marmoricola sp.]
MIAGVLAVLPLTGGLTPEARGEPTAHASTGEGEPGGPVTGPVDHDHDTVKAARASALAAHHHDGSAASTGSTTDVEAVAAAALDPAVFGRWSTLSYKLPLRAVHATLLRTGK